MFTDIAITAKGALTSLDISSNYLGQLVFPAGWEFKKGGMFSADKWVHADGRKQKNKPAKEPAGVIAIADAIPAMGALASLDLSQNSIPAAEMGPIERLCESKQIALRK